MAAVHMDGHGRSTRYGRYGRFVGVDGRGGRGLDWTQGLRPALAVGLHLYIYIYTDR